MSGPLTPAGAVPVARLTRRGAWVSDAPGVLATARTCFLRDHAVHLADFVEPRLLSYVQDQIERDGFTPRVHASLASRPSDLALNPSVAVDALLLVLNDEPFLRFARTLTGRQEIRSFIGTVHRRVPGAGHGCDWHADLTDGRVAALTVNLGAVPYEGGVIQIRREDDRGIVYERAVTHAGDALLFELGPQLTHRVTDPVGAVSRTVLAGWFRTEPARDVFGLGRSPR